jgi:hypothetical protein
MNKINIKYILVIIVLSVICGALIFNTCTKRDLGYDSIKTQNELDSINSINQLLINQNDSLRVLDGFEVKNEKIIQKKYVPYFIYIKSSEFTVYEIDTLISRWRPN